MKEEFCENVNFRHQLKFNGVKHYMNLKLINPALSENTNHLLFTNLG